jgi:hypothetical protein
MAVSTYCQVPPKTAEDQTQSSIAQTIKKEAEVEIRLPEASTENI